jgi:zinc transport system permease protein
VDWLLEPLSHPFMRRALVAGVVTASACGLLGVLIVQRRLSLLSDGLGHATFGGIALSLLLGFSPDVAPWAAIPFTALVALGIGLLQRRARVGSDASIAIFLSVSFALGVLFLGLRSARAQPVDVESLLFGSILGISPATLRLMVVVSGLALAVLAVLWSRLAYATFDSELALLSGVRTEALEALLLVLTSLLVVTAIQAVGVILVGSFIVLPATTARLIGRTLTGVAVLSMALGVGGCLVGLLVSYSLNVTSGATIILTLALVFAGALLASANRAGAGST